MNKYLEILSKIGLGLGYLTLSSCLTTGRTYMQDTTIDNKPVTIVLNGSSGEVKVYVDTLILRETTGDYFLEEILLDNSKTKMDSLFKRIMENSELDSLRKKIIKQKKD